MAGALADGAGAAPSALSVRLEALDGFQRSLVAHPLRHLLFTAKRGVVWLPHQYVAFAQVDGGDAAFVCSVALGVAAGVGAGGRPLQEAPLVREALAHWIALR